MRTLAELSDLVRCGKMTAYQATKEIMERRELGLCDQCENASDHESGLCASCRRRQREEIYGHA